MKTVKTDLRERMVKRKRKNAKKREEMMIERPPRGQCREDSLQLSHNTIIHKQTA